MGLGTPIPLQVLAAVKHRHADELPRNDFDHDLWSEWGGKNRGPIRASTVGSLTAVRGSSTCVQYTTLESNTVITRWSSINRLPMKMKPSFHSCGCIFWYYHLLVTPYIRLIILISIRKQMKHVQYLIDKKHKHRCNCNTRPRIPWKVLFPDGLVCDMPKSSSRRRVVKPLQLTVLMSHA